MLSTRLKKVGALMVGLFLLFSLSPIEASDAVASLGKIRGDVQVDVRSSKRLVPGREGLILRNGDVVLTGKGTNVSIIFRDGSEIRLFQNTKFIVEEASEIKSKKRSFRYKFIMKLGSFWGRFMKGKQNTTIQTPTATIGIKGTALRLKVDEGAGGSSVALSEGVISVKNDDEEIDLHPGKLINGIPKIGSFKNKITSIPYKLTIESSIKKLMPPEDGQETIFFTLQLVEQKTQKNYARGGLVHLSATSDKFQFPSAVRLNQRGYARISAKVKTLDQGDFQEGEAQIFAVMDGDVFDIGSGEVTIPYEIPDDSRTIQINIDSGEITQ